jgi:hypothetical protein
MVVQEYSGRWWHLCGDLKNKQALARRSCGERLFQEDRRAEPRWGDGVEGALRKQSVSGRPAPGASYPPVLRGPVLCTRLVSLSSVSSSFTGQASHCPQEQ